MRPKVIFKNTILILLSLLCFKISAGLLINDGVGFFTTLFVMILFTIAFVIVGWNSWVTKGEGDKTYGEFFLRIIISLVFISIGASLLSGIEFLIIALFVIFLFAGVFMLSFLKFWFQE